MLLRNLQCTLSLFNMSLGAMAWWLEQLLADQENLGSNPALSKCILSPRVEGFMKENQTKNL